MCFLHFVKFLLALASLVYIPTLVVLTYIHISLVYAMLSIVFGMILDTFLSSVFLFLYC